MIGRWCLFFVCCLNTLPAVAFGPSGQWVTPDERPPLVWQQVQDLHWDSGASRSTVDGGGAYVLPGGGSARFLIEEGRYVRLQPANADGVAPGALDTLETLQSRDGAWFYPIAMSGAGSEGDVVSLRPVAADRVIWLRNNGEKSLRVKVFEGRYAAPPTEVTWQPQTLAELPLTTLRQYPQSELQHYHPLQHTIPTVLLWKAPGYMHSLSGKPITSYPAVVVCGLRSPWMNSHRKCLTCISPPTAAIGTSKKRTDCCSAWLSGIISGFRLANIRFP